MRYSLLLTSLALLSALAIPAAAHADTFNFSATGSSGAFSGSGTLTASAQGGGAYLISGITGTGVTGLIAPGGFNGNDNLLFPAATPTLDAHGFSFTDINGPDHFDVNIFNNGSGYFAFLNDEDNLSQTVPVTFSLASAATPEPSTFILLGTGILGLAGATRRRFLTRS
ncbi:MAG TPA: PEP-CTERM sorting domain-containing protein [Edaphobacter sp.]|nr:PEP-CTERM sorting domain-containing protein [Edaphobacter sp.]